MKPYMPVKIADDLMAIPGNSRFILNLDRFAKQNCFAEPGRSIDSVILSKLSFRRLADRKPVQPKYKRVFTIHGNPDSISATTLFRDYIEFNDKVFRKPYFS